MDDLNTTVSGVQATISIYALVLAAFILIGGKLADIVGKKRIFVIDLIIHGLGTTIASFSQNLGMLIFGWSILEGLGGALMIPNIQTILPGEKETATTAGLSNTFEQLGNSISVAHSERLCSRLWQLAWMMESTKAPSYQRKASRR